MARRFQLVCALREGRVDGGQSTGHRSGAGVGKTCERSMRACKPSARSMRCSCASRTRSRNLFALDFDGVLCDSVGESSLSAWRAAEALWPNQFQDLEAKKKKDNVMESMRHVRPVVETGYENVLLVRLLLEGCTETKQVLEEWPTLKERWMSEWKLEREEMVLRFAECRDAWMEEDLEGWLSPNRFYEGTPEALACALDSGEVYIVTTKQERYTAKLLEDMAKTPVRHDRILSTTLSGLPKTSVLEDLQERHGMDAKRMIFVEDKISTLEKVCATPGLERWELYLVTWGYNTKEERERAKMNPRIHLLELHDFRTLMCS